MSKDAPAKDQLSIEDARSVLIQPYITEKTFNMIEKENKLVFIVRERSTKQLIREAMSVLYDAEVIDINTLRTIRGKKAAVKFSDPNGARDLATTLGLV
ncbi:MAG: 50S ribosomal protein L23 [Nitrososphaeraceae archaeon]|jgi:large subunit ribosomal protein L23|nr:50S ribosomal protein L23 [Nitrososphaeraceae archaeon]